MLGSTYTWSLGTGFITGYNVKTFQNITTLDECRALCLEQVYPCCLAVELTLGNCTLNTVNSDTEHVNIGYTNSKFSEKRPAGKLYITNSHITPHILMLFSTLCIPLCLIGIYGIVSCRCSQYAEQIAFILSHS